MDNISDKDITVILKALNLYKMSAAYLSLGYFKLRKNLTEKETGTLISSLERLKKGIFREDEKSINSINEIEKQL